ncbi:MAG: hypothetical protein ACK5H2_10195 [Beutenbergiaceae bacterium]
MDPPTYPTPEEVPAPEDGGVGIPLPVLSSPGGPIRGGLTDISRLDPSRRWTC